MVDNPGNTSDSGFAGTLLAIGGGIEALPGLQTARDMGLKLIVVDGDSAAPGFTLADRCWVISTYEGEAIASAAEAYTHGDGPIHGVIAMCADVPLTVARVAQRLGLPGLSIRTAEWVADKLAMKDRLRAMNIAIPEYMPLTDKADLEKAAEHLGFPFVIKPVDSRGARGVLLLGSEREFEWAWEASRRQSPTGRVMAEEFLDGPQISTETLMVGGVPFTLGFADRNYEWLSRTRPFIVENGGDIPSALSCDDQASIRDLAERAALALDITDGVAKGDMVLTSKGPRVIEIAGRLSGGYFSTVQIPLATGVNFVREAIRISLGQTPKSADLKPSVRRGVAIRYFDPVPGTVKQISGVETARGHEGVHMLKLNIDIGDLVQPLTDHTKRAGFVITSGETKQQAVTRAETAINTIKIRV